MIDTDAIKVGRKLLVVDNEGKTHKAEVERIWSERVGFDVRFETCPATRNSFQGLSADGLVYDFFMREAETGDYGLTLIWPEPEAPAQPFILLDDAGRAALKAGDRVLVEVEIAEGPDSDGEIKGKKEGVRAPGAALPPYFLPSAVYALLTPAPKPIAVGDAVRILGGSTGKVLAQASDGRWAVEYDAGDTTEVRSYDASCLEKVS